MQRHNFRFFLLIIFLFSFFLTNFILVGDFLPGYDGKFKNTLASISSLSGGQNYYVDCSAGNDNNDGKSLAQAWQTLTKVNLTPFSAGDSIWLKRSCVWYENLNINMSGQASLPITYGSYGDGALPVISGAREGSASPIRETGVNIYGANYITIKDLEIREAGVQGGAGIVSYGGSNNNYENLIIRKINGYAGIYLLADQAGQGANNKINNCSISEIKEAPASLALGNRGVGIFLYDSQKKGNIVNNQIANNKIFSNGQAGILIENGQSNLIANNEVYNNGESGIAIAGGSSQSNVIEKNKVYGNTQIMDDRCGINLFQVGSNNVIRYNQVHDDYDTFANAQNHAIIIDPTNNNNIISTCGIRFDGGPGITNTTGNSINYNLVYNEVDGVQIYGYANVQIANNTIHNVKRFGLYLSAPVTGVNYGNQLINNIVSTLAPGEVAGGEKSLLYVNRGSNNIINYNLYTSSTTVVTGADLNSLIANPLFTNIAGNDFSLQSTSPAINRGLGLGFATDSRGQTIKDLPDIGAFETEVISSNPVSPVATTTSPVTEPVCVKKTFYRDADKDSYGNAKNTTSACSVPAGYVTNNKDCNDSVKATRYCSSCSRLFSGNCHR